MVRKKTKILPERRRSKNASTTSRDGSESATSEEPPGVAGMESTLPASPQASRPGTPEKAGPTQLHCKKLQGLANLIEVLSVSIETSQKILQGVISKGLTDPTNPIIKMESAALELNNSRLQCAINLTNAFSALNNTATEEPIETPVSTNKSPVTTPRKTNQSNQSPKLPPPIMLLITDDLRSHLKTLTGKMPTLRIKTAGKYVKLYTDTQPQHDTLKQLLEVLKYPFYTFTPKNERPIKVVIKGLPRSTTTAEIKSDLLDLGYTINKVTQLTGNISKQLLPVFTISLPRNTFNDNIFKLKTLGYLSITVEGFESRGVIQCFQCNQFNHTAEHCHLTPKCLKCGEKHQTRDCQIKRLDTPFCVNCKVPGHIYGQLQQMSPLPQTTQRHQHQIKPSHIE
ncbi:nucleic-acid-binding protein from transposon X-element [Trichonephila clavipes]|nr:nucleic-acid-binding protein from transposon X-element [Trichonephila clavipes]